MFNFMLMMALNNDVDEGKIERISLFKFWFVALVQRHRSRQLPFNTFSL